MEASAQAAGSRRESSLADAVQPTANETRDRIITGIVTVLPFVLLGLAGLAAVEQGAQLA